MTRPNIIMILADDLGWRDLSCYGSDFYETPTLDRLAADGMRFTSAYASCPVCSPTRASILTGKTPARVGVTQWIGGHAVGRLADVPYMHWLPASELSLASALKRAGYATWHVGKWHLGDERTWPERHGFDVNIGGCGWGLPRHGYFSPYHIPTLTDGPEGEYLTDRLTDAAINLIERREPAPFFLNLWHYAVHTPIQAPAELVKKYTEKAARLGLDKRQAIVEGEYFPVLHKRDKRVARRLFQSDPVYAAMMENLDSNIARLLDAVERNGLVDETIVIFTSDNGGLSTAEGSPTCNLPLAEGKGWMYEGGTRVSQIIKWPGVTTPASECAEPVYSCDFYPTLLEAAGLEPLPEQHVDGESLMPLLRLEGSLKRQALYWHYPHYGNQGGAPGSSMRAGDWKLIEHFEDGRMELFNLRQDPGELKNLAADDEPRTRLMHQMLLKWRRETGALVPRPNPLWEPPPPVNSDVHPAEV